MNWRNTISLVTPTKMKGNDEQHKRSENYQNKREGEHMNKDETRNFFKKYERRVKESTNERM